MNGLYTAGARRLFTNFLRGGILNFPRSNMYASSSPRFFGPLGGQQISMGNLGNTLKLWSSNGNGLLDYYDFLTTFNQDGSTTAFYKLRGETKHLVDQLITPYVLMMEEK